MSKASMVKCRAPNTHYGPGVKEIECQAQSERHEQKEKECKKYFSSEGLTLCYELLARGHGAANASSVDKDLDPKKV